MLEKAAKSKVMLPIRLSLGFIIFTEVFFFCGPIEYVPQDPFILVVFLIIVNFCLYLGFKKEAIIYKPRRSSIPMDSDKVIPLTKVLIIFAILIRPITIYVGWQLTSFSLGAFVSKFLVGLNSPSDVYLEYNHITGGTTLSLLLVLLSPITYLATPFGVYFYRKLNGGYKFLVIILILTEIIYCLGLGIRKLMFDEILIVSVAFVSSLGLGHFRLFKNWRISVIILVAIAGLIYYFTYSSLSRNNTEDITNLYGYSSIRPWYKEHTSPTFFSFLANIHMYLTHAYKNLSIALHDFFSFDFDRVFSFGLGNNSFTLDMLEKYLGINLKPYTYQLLLKSKYGADIGQEWMTIYPWLANDVTFLGVPFVVFLIGKLFARFWLDCLYGTNIYALPLLCIMTITVFYSFANNQGLSYSFLPAVFSALLYIIAKRGGIHV